MAEHGFKAVDDPSYDLVSVKKDEGFVATATTPLQPELNLTQTTGFHVECVTPAVTDKEIDAVLERRRNAAAELVPHKGPAVKGNIVHIDYEGLLDGKPFQGGSAQNQTLQLGSGRMIPGFEDGILGHKGGEEFEINVTFPVRYHVKDLAGKPVVFKIKLIDVCVRQLPALNSDFAKKVGKVDTMEAFREQVRKQLHDGKHAMVYSRLSRRLRETGHTSFSSYLGWLEQQGDGVEWQEFVNALTTNLTAFFRENHHFEIFATHLRSKPTGTPWRVWCNAASTGEEPYSIVITALETLGANASLKLTASDIDSRVLAKAAEGVYRMEAARGLSQERLQRFFLRGKAGNAGLIRAKPELRRMIEFMSVNLIRDDWPFREPFDVVFCRNVMIYFDAPTQRRVLERIHRVLKPGGMLFVGHAENFSESRDLFTLRGKTVYERR